MTRLIVRAIVGIALAVPGAAWASHLNCSRAWPGTPTEANQAWAACKLEQEQEHTQRARDAVKAQEQGQERRYQRQLDERRSQTDERRTRALEDAARAAEGPTGRESAAGNTTRLAGGSIGSAISGTRI